MSLSIESLIQLSNPIQLCSYVTRAFKVFAFMPWFLTFISGTIDELKIKQVILTCKIHNLFLEGSYLFKKPLNLLPMFFL